MLLNLLKVITGFYTHPLDIIAFVITLTVSLKVSHAVRPDFFERIMTIAKIIFFSVGTWRIGSEAWQAGISSNTACLNSTMKFIEQLSSELYPSGKG
jgi:hypothetical protein